MLRTVNLISNYSNKDIPSGSINMTQREGNSLQKNSSLGKHFGLLLHPPPANPPIDNNPGLSTNHVSITGTGYINWNCILSKDFRDLVTHSEFLVGFRGIWFNCTRVVFWFRLFENGAGGTTIDRGNNWIATVFGQRWTATGEDSLVNCRLDAEKKVVIRGG